MMTSPNLSTYENRMKSAISRAYGNAIVPQVAAEVIGAYMDIASLPTLPETTDTRAKP
jgi:hypothetical protein